MAPEEALNWKNQFPCFKNTLSEHYKTLQRAYIWKNFEFLLNLQNTTINVNLYRG